MGGLGSDDVRERTVATMLGRAVVDTQQAMRVDETASALGSQLAQAWGFGPRELRMLHMSARLHEVGQMLSFGGYHRHGAYIIANSDMPGFSEQGQAYLSALVAAHRRRLHAEKLAFLRLVDGERAVRIAVLLRLAVRLNRGRGGAPTPIVRLHEHRLELTFEPGFLESSPMTRADLEEEQELLKSAGIEMTFK